MKLVEIDGKIATTLASVEKIRKYMFWTAVITFGVVVLPILAIIVLPYYEPWDPPVELRGRVVGLYQWPSKVEASPANRYPSSPLKFPTQASGPEKRFGQISLSVKDLGRSG